MIILAYGIEQPTTGDVGSVFFPALEHLCQRMASHNHDGVNSAPISSTSIVGSNVLAPTGSWALVSLGLWQQTVTLPAGFLYDSSIMECREEVTKEFVYPTILKVDNTHLTVQAINNLLGIRIYLK